MHKALAVTNALPTIRAITRKEFMSSNALIMPPAPQPPAGGAGNASGTHPTAFERGRPAQSADEDQRFLTTLNRACERKPCSLNRSRGGESRSAKSSEKPPAAAHPKSSRRVSDDEPLQDRPVESAAGASEPELPRVCRQPSLGSIHQLLLKMAVADDDAAAIEGQSDVDADAIQDFVNQLIGHLNSEGYTQLAGLADSGPFEQLPADLSELAGKLQLLKQLANRFLNDQPAADPAGRRADLSYLEFWRTLASAPTGGANPEARSDAFAARVDHLIQFLLQHAENRPAAPGLEGASSETGGQKTAVTLEALAADENLLVQKLMDPKKTAEIQTVMDGKDGHGSAGGAKNSIAEALLEGRIDKNNEDAPAARMQSGSKTAEAAVDPNLAGQNGTAKPAEETVNLKTSALQNDMLSADLTGKKAIQADGESKDTGFLTSQENLPEHLSKLENGSRSAEGSQRSLASQTLNQIVQKAVFLNNNGQNTVQIDLKPEFLGHIRMHIMTESHQVAVRIVAELPIVKDMLENNLNQLKAELQAQGLQVDELEVSVAHDNCADDDRYQKAAEVRRVRASRNNHISAEGDAESRQTRLGIQRNGTAQTAVDYFA
jgi:flagellar hook-length control protein FliK